MAGVTFSDSDSAPVPKFWNPDLGPKTFQIWESDFCSDSTCHRSNCNFRLLFILQLSSIELKIFRSGPDFSQIFDFGSVSERKTLNLAGVDSGTPSMATSGLFDLTYLLHTGSSVRQFVIKKLAALHSNFQRVSLKPQHQGIGYCAGSSELKRWCTIEKQGKDAVTCKLGRSATVLPAAKISRRRIYRAKKIYFENNLPFLFESNCNHSRRYYLV